MEKKEKTSILLFQLERGRGTRRAKDALFEGSGQITRRKSTSLEGSGRGGKGKRKGKSS